jgi:hypothetical protein
MYKALLNAFNTVGFYGEQLLAPHPSPKLEDHLLSAVCDGLFTILTTTLHIWRLFLHPQPEDALCCGDRDPFTMDRILGVEIKRKLM